MSKEKQLPRTSFVLITHNRKEALSKTLPKIEAIHSNPIYLVDNNSTDQTLKMISQQFPHVRVIPFKENIGPSARNIGAKIAGTDFFAVVDDDSYWGAGALKKSEQLFDKYPKLGAIYARTIVHGTKVDPVNTAIEQGVRSTYERDLGIQLPGIPIIGGIACAMIFRTEAFLGAGGYNSKFGIGGEEMLLALDMIINGWGISYVKEITAYHDPVKNRSAEYLARRHTSDARSAFYTAWLRRPDEIRENIIARLEQKASDNPDFTKGLQQAKKNIDWLKAERRVIPDWLEKQLQLQD